MSTTLPSKRDFLATGLTPIPDTHPTGSCPLCHKTITDTVAIPCSNQHAFCKSCIIVWTTVNKKCPLDGEVLYQGPDRRTNVFYLLEVTMFDDGGGGMPNVGPKIVYLLGISRSLTLWKKQVLVGRLGVVGIQVEVIRRGLVDVASEFEVKQISSEAWRSEDAKRCLERRVRFWMKPAFESEDKATEALASSKNRDCALLERSSLRGKGQRMEMYKVQKANSFENANCLFSRFLLRSSISPQFPMTSAAVVPLPAQISPLPSSALTRPCLKTVHLALAMTLRPYVAPSHLPLPSLSITHVSYPQSPLL